MSNGFKLPILAIFKQNSQQKIESINNEKLVCTSNQSGWANEKIILNYLNKTIFNLKHFEQIQFCFIWDQCPAHQSKEIKELFRKNNIELNFIPSGCTSLVQPLDVSLNKPFKNNMKLKFESWFQEIGCKPQNKTKKGYIIPPSKQLMQNWIISSFE
ncbi:hypothetical protein ABPG72_020375 [Tetrahymena utriculariae]